MFGLGAAELVVILVIGLVLFGSSKLPQVGSGLGKAIRDFRKSIAGIENDLTSKELNDDNSKVFPRARGR